MKLLHSLLIVSAALPWLWRFGAARGAQQAKKPDVVKRKHIEVETLTVNKRLEVVSPRGNSIVVGRLGDGRFGVVLQDEDAHAAMALTIPKTGTVATLSLDAKSYGSIVVDPRLPTPDEERAGGIRIERVGEDESKAVAFLGFGARATPRLEISSRDGASRLRSVVRNDGRVQMNLRASDDSGDVETQQVEVEVGAKEGSALRILRGRKLVASLAASSADRVELGFWRHDGRPATSLVFDPARGTELAFRDDRGLVRSLFGVTPRTFDGRIELFDENGTKIWEAK